MTSLENSRTAVYAGAALTATVIAVASPASAQRPLRTWEDTSLRDFDEREQTSTLWERTLNPGLDLYSSKLVANAVRLLSHSDDQSRSEAETLLRRAIQLRPDLPTAHWLLGHLYVLERNWRQCAQSWKTVFDIDPEYDPRNDPLIGRTPPRDAHVLLDFGLARCSALSGDYEEAIDHYKRVITGEKAIGAYRVYWRLGEAYAALGRLQEAIDSLTTAARLHPREALIAYALAVVYDRDEQLARARQTLSTALALDPHLGQLARDDFQPTPPEDEWYCLGLANEAREPSRPEWALVYFRRFLAAHGDGPWARRTRQHVDELAKIPLSSTRILQEGAAHVDHERAVRAIERASSALQQCVQSAPNALFRVRVTLVDLEPPRSRRGSRARFIAGGNTSAPLPGVRATVDYSFGAEETEIAVITHCLDSVAAEIDMPPATGGDMVVVSFPVIAQ